MSKNIFLKLIIATQNNYKYLVKIERFDIYFQKKIPIKEIYVKRVQTLYLTETKGILKGMFKLQNA